MTISKILDMVTTPLATRSTAERTARLEFDLGAINNTVATFQGQLNRLHTKVEEQDKQIAELTKAVKVLIAREGKRGRRR